MTNPFAPPNAEVNDVLERQRATLARLLLVITGASLAALLLSWVVAPMLAGLLASALGQPVEPPGSAMLIFDVIFSLVAFTACCFLAAKLCAKRELHAVSAVAAIGSAIFFFEAGGLSGMLNAEYPLWYEFVPTHIGAAILALTLLRQRDV